MKKFDIVWKAKRGGKVTFNDINVPAADVESAIAAVRAKHGWMVQEIVSVTEFVPHTPPLDTLVAVAVKSMPSWGTYGT